MRLGSEYRLLIAARLALANEDIARDTARELQPLAPNKGRYLQLRLAPPRCRLT